MKEWIPDGWEPEGGWTPEALAVFQLIDDKQYLQLTAGYGRIGLAVIEVYTKGPEQQTHINRLAASRRGKKFNRLTRKYE